MKQASSERSRNSARSPMAVGGALGLFLLLLACFPLSAQAAEQHLFNPTLSLTGSCSTEKVDPVPDPWCPGPPGPSAPFENPNLATDSYGNMYVSSHEDMGPGGRIDVFGPGGKFITEIAVKGPRSLAVDSEGHLYVAQDDGITHQLSRFSPLVYEPEEEEIEYGAGVVLASAGQGSCLSGAKNRLAIDPRTDRLFTSPGSCVREWSSAAEPGGNEPLATIGSGVLTSWAGAVALDATRNRLYVVDSLENAQRDVIRVFELDAPHTYLGMITGAATPEGRFRSTAGWLALDAFEETGHLFVSDIAGKGPVYEMGPGFGAQEAYFETFKHQVQFVKPGEVEVDNSPLSPNHGSFFVPSGSVEGPLHHTYAFVRTELVPPTIESASATEVTATEALLRARINPGGDATSYRFEYTPQQSFDAAGGFEGAATALAGEGTIAAETEGVNVSAAITGLAPGTAYRFRVLAENSVGEDTREGSFRTFLAPSPGGVCPNEALRTGWSANLPDCRAYELVTPADTNGRTPLGAAGTGVYFPTLQASPDGSKASFRIEGGTIPGFEGSGSFNGDNYLARRGPGGWGTELVGPSGAEAVVPNPGGFSPDQEHSFWSAESVIFPHISYPGGHSAPVGRGSLGVDPQVDARLISHGGSHVIFNTSSMRNPIQLEPNAPPSGTAAVYDRTADEVTHVVSLLPGDLTPAAGQNARYIGASYDGRGVAFEIEGTLYLRHDNRATYEVGKGLTYAGVAEGGGRIFYLQSGNLFALDVAGGPRIAFSKGGKATPVNVSADGTTAYFISPDVLSGKNPNPNGALAQPGQHNLYLSREGQISFVGTVEDEDLERGTLSSGLGAWVASLEVVHRRTAIATSRTTPDGAVLLFEAAAPLAGYDPEGKVQIYRYDSRAPSLTCLSCNPTGAPAGGDASLQTLPFSMPGEPLMSATVRMANLRPDGNRAFFQSHERLALADVDGRQDVYEWEAQGVGSCDRPGGCVYLISSGQSARDDHLFAVSESGDDVFFWTADILLPRDREQTPSIYNAKVGGGFPEGTGAAPCQGEGCRGALTPGPTLAAADTRARGETGNVRRRSSCAKAARQARRASRSSKRLHRAARRAARNDQGRRARRLAVASKRAARRAQRASRAAKRCRARARAERRAGR